MSQNSNKYHRYGMIAVIGCCMLYGAVSGIGANCKGIFYSVVAQDLGVKLPSVTLYSTFYGFAAALTIPISTKLFHRISARIFLTPSLNELISEISMLLSIFLASDFEISFAP